MGVFRSCSNTLTSTLRVGKPVDTTPPTHSDHASSARTRLCAKLSKQSSPSPTPATACPLLQCNRETAGYGNAYCTANA